MWLQGATPTFMRAVTTSSRAVAAACLRTVGMVIMKLSSTEVGGDVRPEW
jgi:hypothetical protein